MNTYSIEQFRIYLSQVDSLGDALYKLSEKSIADALYNQRLKDLDLSIGDNVKIIEMSLECINSGWRNNFIENRGKVGIITSIQEDEIEIQLEEEAYTYLPFYVLEKI